MNASKLTCFILIICFLFIGLSFAKCKHYQVSILNYIGSHDHGVSGTHLAFFTDLQVWDYSVPPTDCKNCKMNECN